MTTEPAALVRPARTLVIDLARIGAEWAATSAQFPALREFGDDQESAKAAAREKLGPAVRIEFREVP